MTGYKHVLQWIREGKTPEQIVKRFDGQPSQLRRILQSKRLREALELDEMLAGAVAIHKTAAGVSHVAARLAELAEGSNPETARKACLSLLSEGIFTTREDDEDDPSPPNDPRQGLLHTVSERRPDRDADEQTPHRARRKRKPHTRAARKTRTPKQKRKRRD